MKKEKVLVIEDDKGTRNAIKILLELNNIEVNTTDDNRQVLKKLENDSFNLIICAAGLALNAEYPILTEVKENPKHFKTPFIVLADLRDEALQRNIMDLGADDFIVKPFSSKVMLNTIRLKMDRTKKYRKYYDTEYNNRVFSLLNKDFSQELVTSLNGISNATFLLDSLPGAENIEGLNELVGIINSSRFRLQRIAQNLRTYSQLNTETSSDLLKDKKNVVLQNVLHLVLSNYEDDPDHGYKKTDVSVLQVGHWEGNEQYVKLLFTELIDNAIKFNSTSYLPHIQLRAINDNFTFSVTNYLRSNSSFTIKDVSPFTKFHHDLSHNGLGLGLAVCKSICDKLNYKLTLSKEGNYITFTVESE